MAAPSPYSGTPVDPDDLIAFVPGVSLATMDEVYQAETVAIAAASEDLLLAIANHEIGDADLTRPGTLEDIHEACFGSIWQWAGILRQRELSIGVEPASLRQRLPEELGTIAWQIENETASPEWIAMNAHHRLVYLHPFTDGNGRVTRLFADALLFALTDGTRVFDWIEDVPTYLQALRAADLSMSPQALLAVIGVREV